MKVSNLLTQENDIEYDNDIVNNNNNNNNNIRSNWHNNEDITWQWKMTNRPKEGIF